MKFMTTINIAVGIGAALFFASLAPPAQAQDADNPWLPKPAASTATPGHGHDTYCTRPILGTCSLADVIAGKNGLGEVRVSITPETKITKPTKPPCGGDEGGDEGDTGGDTGSPAAGKMKG